MHDRKEDIINLISAEIASNMRTAQSMAEESLSDEREAVYKRVNLRISELKRIRVQLEEVFFV